MKATNGKLRATDAADTEQILRLIQSIPSPNAEPFKIWMAKVGYERIEETEDPELAFDRAMETSKNLIITFVSSKYSILNQFIQSIIPFYSVFIY